MPYPGPPLAGYGDFRVLQLQPGATDDRVCFSLDLAYSPGPGTQLSYEALSYAWGDLTLTHEIHHEIPGTTESGSLMITTNCYNALVSLRWTDKPRCLWIDAICINQQDLEERNQQVGMMRTIYSGARQVISYIGEDDSDSESVMKWLQDEYEPINYPRSEIEYPPPTTAAWESFITRPYFYRVWVLQEVFNAKSVELHCGKMAIPWKALQTSSYLSYSKRHDLGLQSLQIATEVVANVTRALRELKDANMGARLLRLLILSRSCLSSDPRDKVYGILPLLSIAEVFRFAQPDYSLSPARVFTSFALYLYKACGLDVLREACTIRHLGSVEMLPSWVPDWTYRGKPPGVPTRIERTFTAGGKPIKLFRPQSSVAVDAQGLRSLSVQGIRIGSPITLAEACDVEGNVFPLGQWCKIVEENLCITIRGAREPTTPSQNETRDVGAFYRLLTHDQVIYSIAITLGIIYIIDWEDEKSLTIPLKDSFKSLPHSYRRQVQDILDCCDGNKLVIIDNGLMGLVPAHTEMTDTIFVLPGASVPFVFRKLNDHYTLVGECYVQGIMDGEACSGETASLMEQLTIE